MVNLRRPIGRLKKKVRTVKKKLGNKNRGLVQSYQIDVTTPSLGDLFFLGQHDDVIEMFYAVGPEALTIGELHLVFASMSMTHSDSSDVLSRLPQPLSVVEFNLELKRQLQDETSHATTNILGQPKFLHKTIFAAALGLRAGKKHFVETGTYTGASIYMISSLFEGLWTVEASQGLHEAAVALFRGKNVTSIDAVIGDSRTMLQDVESTVLNEAVVFLDAHYSTGITSNKYGACPVVEEIAIILRKAPKALIVVDDLRTMNGRNGYPTLEDILATLPHTARVQLAFDQLVVGESWLSDLLP